MAERQPVVVEVGHFFELLVGTWSVCQPLYNSEDGIIDLLRLLLGPDLGRGGFAAPWLLDRLMEVRQLIITFFLLFFDLGLVLA